MIETDDFFTNIMSELRGKLETFSLLVLIPCTVFAWSQSLHPNISGKKFVLCFRPSEKADVSSEATV